MPTTTKPLTSIPCPMVRTTYLGPTNTRGSRIRAYSLGAGNHAGFRVIVPYLSELGTCENHERAAIALRDKIAATGYGFADGATILACCSEDGGGYVFAFVRTGAEVPQ